MSYSYDIFVSYTRTFTRGRRQVESAVGHWVKTLFYPRLCELWHDARPGGQVFLDEEGIPSGAAWPDALGRALRESRCLVPVWSPPFFQSQWCLAEWRSMLRREQLCGIDRARGSGLVVPVVFYDGESFPDDAKETQHLDFREHAHLRAGDFNHATETPLRKLMLERLVPDLVAAVERAPAWRADFPLAPVDTDKPPPPPLFFPAMST